MAHEALGQGAAELLQGNGRQLVAFVNGVGNQLAIAPTARTLHIHKDLRRAIAIEIRHLCAHHRAIHGLADRFDRALTSFGGDGELLL